MLDDARLRRMADDLCLVRGVHAVSLGGSRARGTHRPDSDFDLGVYYDVGLDRDALEELASRWSDQPVPVAGPGGWGPWVDGGAWLTVDGTPVDWILRDRRRVIEQAERALRGDFAFHYQPGHPLGFLDVAYAAEVVTSVHLHDDEGMLGEISRRLDPYPTALRASLLSNMWQIDFLLDGASKAARSSDVAYVTLCLTTASMVAAHGWHAAAGNWITTEKSLLPGVARLPIDTRNFTETITFILSRIGETPEELHAAISAMRSAPRPPLD
ncbi:nucleotidyltransferase domain-containing protein [Microcella daejeonensis]|uniref:Nucleotidyltransferase domain-containing protein n=1 Tax=Microcella daejeonensis TaxID=2994971 RepID=A0A9E8MMG5_9MICO|nr:nucleotidyltransferase domain-containing protein [Microcella daejeonensis]WAB82139.1 nucleotidyltransferase domain-containing protein [Microcella daejeonensis]